jgi:hypothetical protein
MGTLSRLTKRATLPCFGLERPRPLGLTGDRGFLLPQLGLTDLQRPSKQQDLDKEIQRGKTKSVSAHDRAASQSDTLTPAKRIAKVLPLIWPSRAV